MGKPWPHYFRSAVFAALWGFPIAVAIFLVWKHAVPLPFWDEWNTPGAQLASWYRGTLTFAELCSQHNESRKLVPRLVYLPLFGVIGWNARLALVLVMTTACLFSASLYQLSRHTVRAPAAAGAAFVVMNLLLFSPRQYENFLNPVQWETFLPGLALVVGLIVNLSRRSLAWKTVCNAALALVSTYTFANGMLLWLLAFPLGIDADARSTSGSMRSWRLAYVFAGALSVLFYFAGYQHPPLSPPAASIATDGPALIQFFLIWFGSLFRVPNASVAGAIVVLSFLGLAGIALWLMAKRKEWRAHYPWLVLGAYALISGAITAVARLGFTLSIATDAHYTVFTVVLYIAVVGLAFTVSAQLGEKMARPGAVLAVVAALVLLIVWAPTFTAQRLLLRKLTEYRNHMLLVLRWAEALPHNPELAWLSPYPEMPQTISTLAQHDVLRPRLVSKSLAAAVRAVPPNESGTAGLLEQATPDGNGRFLVKGRARLPETNRPADCVVVGWETATGWEPRWVVETGSNGDFARPLVANVPAGGATFRAWAIDLQLERAYPLAAAISVTP